MGCAEVRGGGEETEGCIHGIRSPRDICVPGDLCLAGTHYSDALPRKDGGLMSSHVNSKDKRYVQTDRIRDH